MTPWWSLLACATCVVGPWDKADLGFFWSAVFLMALPVALAGLIAGWIYYVYRGARRSAEGRPSGGAFGLVPREKENGQ